MWYLYTMDCYSAIKKNEILSSTATWSDLKGNYTEWNKSDRERHTAWSYLYVESKKHNELTN